MAKRPLPDHLTSTEVLGRHLKSLLRRDPRLRPIAKAAGPFEVRLTTAGFVGLTRVVIGQQLSVPSARAITARVEALPGASDPKRFLKLSEAKLRAAGLSAGKVRTIRIVAEAVAAGVLDFALVERLGAEDAVAHLTVHKGIGPWTAEIYLMFATGHPDIFPIGDLALRKAVGHGLQMAELPTPLELAEIAQLWAPHRHAAALLFWRYYGSLKNQNEGTAL